MLEIDMLNPCGPVSINFDFISLSFNDKLSDTISSILLDILSVNIQLVFPPFFSFFIFSVFLNFATIFLAFAYLIPIVMAASLTDTLSSQTALIKHILFSSLMFSEKAPWFVYYYHLFLLSLYFHCCSWR
ncbi:hypothetical protein CDIK_3579 [Cucumispora dikerogammari]|nr:hypothetical protein CDIK_3579 [Cucumispora dikerogammari]